MEDERSTCLDALESTKALIKKSDGEPEGYYAAYFLQDQADDDDTLNTSILFQQSGRLSLLGIEKCTRLFALFDIDNNGVWSYQEFQDYLMALKRSNLCKKDPLHYILNHNEAWSMYMCDNYESTTNGELTLKGFFLYREATENLYPLAHDLMFVGIPWICDGLLRHMFLQKLFLEYDVDGNISLKCLPYLMAECGYIIPISIVQEIIRHQKIHFECMEWILQRNRAIRLFGYKQKSRVDCRNTDVIYRDAFVALALSGYSPPQLPICTRFFLEMKYQSFALIRVVQKSLANVQKYIQRACLTGLLNAERLLPTTFGDYTFKFDIGDTDFSTAAELQFTLNTKADSSATLYNLGYRHNGAECFIYFDFIARSDITNEDLDATVAAMNKLVERHCLDHFKLMSYYHSYLVVSPPKLETHGTPVVRVVVLFTEALDPFNVFAAWGLPSLVQIDNFISTFELSLFFNVSLSDVLTNKRFCCLDHLAIRGFFTSRIGRQTCSQLLKQILYQYQYEDKAAEFTEEILSKEKEKFKRGKRKSKAPYTTWAHQWKVSNSTRLRHIREFFNRMVSFLDFSKTISIAWSFPSFHPIFGTNNALQKLLSHSTFAKIHTMFSTTGFLCQQWKDIITALDCQLNKMQTPIDSGRTPSATFLDEAEANKEVLDIYSILAPNIWSVSTVRAQAGSIGVDILLEGFDWIPLLPKLHKNRS
ncbi:hypothetical protein THRCLA_09067 [Thraustotheca clavata]|uniref:EF-hand domain-containing protein n=1 Tax=Thraustotheca clavata TaxID=74557 RepID=A0A1V9YZN8_9STRA|nr:hypothetical protein THRCLA_09067 [Thraustotheca clavata]